MPAKLVQLDALEGVESSAYQKLHLRPRRVDREESCRRQEVLEEERGELRAPVEPGFPVHRHGVLAHRALTAIRARSDLLVPVSLQQVEGHLTLGGCEPPGRELRVDGAPESGPLRFCLAQPRILLHLTLGELNMVTSIIGAEIDGDAYRRLQTAQGAKPAQGQTESG